MKLLLCIYNLVFPFVLAFLLPGAVWRMWKRGNYAHKFGQRFALYSSRTRAVLRQNRGRWVWVHAVSVGEVLIALKFIRELQAARDLPVLLSTTTSTGFALASEKRSPNLEVIYHPLDFFPAARRAIRTVRPSALVLVEAEVWPNLLWQARSNGAPAILINARLSSRSEKRYRAGKFLAAPLFRSLDAICLQGPEDHARFVSIGADPSALHVTGSIKFDLAAGDRLNSEPFRKMVAMLGWKPGAPVLLGASTHAGEEAILARVYRKLLPDFPDLRLIVVPRHAERSAKVLQEITSLGLTAVRRSKAGEGRAQVLLVDTTGELRQWMEVAGVVFIGKTLAAQGGQNPAEAIAARKPVVFGPNMQNFSALADLVLSVDGARQVRDEAELETALRQLLVHPDAAEQMASRALAALEPHRGATKRTLDILFSLPKP